MIASKWSFALSTVGPSGEDESQEDVLMDEAPSNMSQASTLQANREGLANSQEYSKL